MPATANLNPNEERLTVHDNQVSTTVRVKTSKDAPRTYNLSVSLDFTGVPKKQLLVWAFRSRVIDLQASLRRCSPDLLDQLEHTGIERFASEAGAAFVDPAKQREALVEKAKAMGAEERAALIAALMNM